MFDMCITRHRQRAGSGRVLAYPPPFHCTQPRPRLQTRRGYKNHTQTYPQRGRVSQPRPNPHPQSYSKKKTFFKYILAILRRV